MKLILLRFRLPSLMRRCVCLVAPGAAFDLALALSALNFDWQLASHLVFSMHLVNNFLFACKKNNMSFPKISNVLNLLMTCTSHLCGDNLVWIIPNPKMLLVLKLDGVIKTMPCYPVPLVSYTYIYR